MAQVTNGFICSTCGVSSAIESQLCRPVKLERRTACRYRLQGHTQLQNTADKTVFCKTLDGATYIDKHLKVVGAENFEPLHHLCDRIAKKVRYNCVSCGRLSTVNDFLCYPQPISRTIKKSIKGKVRIL